MLRAIRRRKGLMRVPFIIIIVALAIGLVGAYSMIPATNDIPNPGSSGSDAASNNSNSTREEQLNKNISQLQQALKGSPNNPTLLLSLGNDYYDLGNYLVFEAGRTEEGIRQFALAVTAYEKVVSEGKADANVLVDMATAAFYSDQDDKARSGFEKALKLEPKHLQALYNYGVFLNSRGEGTEAGAKWERVVELDPQGEQGKLARERLTELQKNGQK